MTFDHKRSHHDAPAPEPFVVQAGEARDPRSGGRTLAKATAAATGGALGLLHSRLEAGPAAPLHVHTLEDEAWIVEDGELEFTYTARPIAAGDEPTPTSTARVDAGAFVFVPRRHAHSLRVLSDTATVWTLLLPGGLEDFLLDRDAGDDDPTTGAADDPDRFGITIYDE